ncbi:MAG: hypothetical protein IH960_04385 [Chloroflexi bacterium]|nr:hypothetical protein [Chloroflexota bacterium]MCH8230553.1 hypothetical protein [Chloroflexota bacterium]
MPDYPQWIYYPIQQRPPQWAIDLIEAVSTTTLSKRGNASKNAGKSDQILQRLMPKLSKLGFQTEDKASKKSRISRPVLFGQQGSATITYEVDGYHPEHRIVLEIEAGRAWMGNAVYRDLVRTSLIADADYLALGVMIEYSYKSKGRDIVSKDFSHTKDLLDAVFSSQKLILPFKGILLFGY